MDEAIDLTNTCPWETEEITEECILFRQVHAAQRDKNRKFPNPAHFGLREDEDYLSFNWIKYINEPTNFTLIGISYNKKGVWLNPREYSVFKFPVSFLKKINRVSGIKHIPVFDETNSPSLIGKPNNKSHAGVYFSENDLQLRVSLSEYCEDIDNVKCDFDVSIVVDEIARLRDLANDTPYHKDWNFSSH